MAKRDNVKKKKKETGHYNFIDLEEVQAREQKYATRLQDIKTHAVYTDEAIKQFERMQRQRLVEDHWQRYLRCDGQPRPDSPPQIRSFVARQRYFMQIDSDNTVDWQLGVNERSLLTQDISSIDATRKTIHTKKCPNIGSLINGYIDKYLKALKEIDLYLENDFELCRINLNKAYEIITLRIELENEIFDTLDHLIYRIIAHDSAFMSTIDGLVETYRHAGNAFRLDLWALTNVPVRFEQFDLPMMAADLNLCQVNVQIPLSVLKNRLTLACLHTNFDYYSSKAKSFEHIVTVPTDNLNAGIPDMETCLVNEWLWYNDIQDEIRQKLLSQHERYVEALSGYEASLKDKSKREGEKSDKSKAPKAPKAPPFLGPNMYPDITHLFLEREQNQWLEFLNEYYHPSRFALNENEINLRSSLILGGIYTLYFVRRPQHFDFAHFNTTSHEHLRKLHVYKDLVANTKLFASMTNEENAEVGEENRQSQLSTRRRTRYEKSITRLTNPQDNELANNKTELNDFPYFFVTFKLEPNLCRWGQPTVCQFVETELKVPLTRQTLHYDILAQYRERVGSKILESDSDETLAMAEDFGRGRGKDRDKDRHSSVLTQTRISAGVEDFEQNVHQHRLNKSINIFRPKLSSLLRNFDMPRSLLQSVAVPNFPLDQGALTKTQVRTMTEHCMPRLLPSFVFPMEARAELERLSELKTKKGLTLMRKREEEVEPDLQPIIKTIFTYEGALQPEYVFPTFDAAHDINYGDDEPVFVNADEEPQSFHELVEVLDDIKRKYLAHYRKIVYQTEFEPRLHAQSIAKARALHSSPSPSATKLEVKVSQSKIAATKSKVRVSVDAPQKPTAETEEQLLDNEADFTNFENLTDKERKRSTIDDIPTKITTIKCWTTEFIKSSVFNKEDFTVTVQTDRLGIFGFAYDRYEHFPFRNWKMHSNPEQEGEVIFQLDTQHVRLVLYVSNKGYRGYVTDLTKGFVLRPVKYVDIEEPIDDFNELKKRLIEKNVSIFAENDAGFYIKKGRFCQKHLATEHHTYDAMALHCMLLKFDFSLWNCLATRRNIVLQMRGKRDDDETLLLRITPEQTTFVDIKELCSNDINVFNLEYTPTWRNISLYTDLNNAICSIYSNAFELINKDAGLVSNLWKLLHAIKPLSFS